MHCFSGDAAFARACLDRGALPLLRRHGDLQERATLRDALAVTPRDRLLVETDAPFLTPMPFRGRPNASTLSRSRAGDGRGARRTPRAAVRADRREHRRRVRRILVTNGRVRFHVTVFG